SDEVLMGFRLRCGPSCRDVGLEPDLLTLGKAVGSGIPVAAVLGTKEAFRAVEDGRANRAGTYHGNPLATAAVLATLDELRKQDYAALLARGDRLRAVIVEAFAAAGVVASTGGYGSVFSLWFAPEAPTRYEGARAVLRPEASAALHLALRRQGVVTIPGGWGRIFLSFAHDDETLGMTAEAFRKVAPEIAAILGSR
ncbi:aminotransferase class III-fold pyridoxal phosphate-dependent enzyme, partial [Nostoc sp. NIES-2111]